MENGKYDIKSIASPASRRNFTFGLQLREMNDERRLANHRKYLRIWDKIEDKVLKHFQQQEDIKSGKTTSVESV